MSAQIIGNLTGALIIERSSGVSFFIIMSLMAFGASLLFCCLIMPTPFPNRESQIEQSDYSVKQMISQIAKEDKQNFCKDMQGTFKLMFTREMMAINLLLVWSGCSISYWSTMLTPIMSLQVGDDKSDNDKLQLALFGMVAFGFGEVIGGFIHGLIIDQVGSRASIKVNLLVMVVTFSATLWSLNDMHYNNYTFLMCFMWGYEDGTVNIFIFQLLGFEFGGIGDPFAIFTFLQGLSVFCFDLL